MMTSEGDSETGPTSRGRAVRRTWGAAAIVSGELAPGAVQDFGEATVPSATLLLCAGTVSVGAGSATIITDPIVYVGPAGEVTLRAHTAVGVVAVSVPATGGASSREDSETHEEADAAPWWLVAPGAYTDGIRALVATLLEDESAHDETADALVERILTQAVQGVAVRY
ncbi:hypothetical protein QF046_001417 [Microbacterium sp. W4I4]|uniref:hypothetical protein n=1 Tax=Microbacterium sp. W4I4 TaxID=3042295 RepID=UPI00277D554C|nr:hypothetical protein [Microbacterium sp. W4I4]MDQ0613776.1 hypothetical protein [Microbacterium sp. W4I4]